MPGVPAVSQLTTGEDVAVVIDIAMHRHNVLIEVTDAGYIGENVCRGWAPTPQPVQIPPGNGRSSR